MTARAVTGRVIALALAFVAALAPGPTKAAEPVTLLLRWDHQFQFAGYYAALWKGYYADAGLDVTIRTPFKEKSILDSVEQVVSGGADFAIGAADLLVARDKGKPVVALGTIFHQSAAEFYIRRGSGYANIGDLSRLRVARRIGDLLDIEFQAVLLAEGIDPKSVKPVSAYAAPHHLASGKLDVIPAYSFVTPFLLNAAGVDYLSVKPHDYGINFYGDTLFTREDLISQNPDAVKKFMAASVRGWEYAIEHPVEIADLIATKLTRRFPVADAIAFNRAQIEGVKNLTLYPLIEVGHMNPGRWQHMHRWLEKAGLVTRPLDIDRFIYDPEKRAAAWEHLLLQIVSAIAIMGAALGAVAWIWFLRRTVAARTVELNNKAEEAEAAAVAKSQFLATMSHELRTPMHGILGTTGLILGTELSPAQRRYAETIKLTGDALLTLLNSILDLSKIEAGGLKLETSHFPFKPLLDSVTAIMESQCRHKGLAFEIDVAPDVPAVLIGDPERVRQVLFNLVGNAIKFTESGGITVRVSQTALDDKRLELRFEVRDTGIGIDAEQEKRIFDRFAQADASTTRKYGGTGLGLAICRELSQLMGGSIGLHGNPDRGSTFWFTVCCEPGDAAKIDASSHAGRSGDSVQIATGRPLRILVAEDNPVNQVIAAETLESFGHQVDVVSDGTEAIEAVQSYPYDVVLMDIYMPEMDGLAATKEIRALSGDVSKIPIIALTADAMAGEREKYLAAGMNDYVSKPFDQNQLNRAIARCVDGAAASPA